MMKILRLIQCKYCLFRNKLQEYMKKRYLMYVIFNTMICLNLWYLTFAFCSVYKNSTKSWMLGFAISLTTGIFIRLFSITFNVISREMALSFQNS